VTVTFTLPSMPDVQVLEYLDPQARSPFAAWFDGLNAVARPERRRNAERRHHGTHTGIHKYGRGTGATRPTISRSPLHRGTQCLFLGRYRRGKTILRDLVNATIGFEELAATLKKPSKSLHRMLAPRGNPSTENFFSIVCALHVRRLGVRREY
jgi:hypothetical protein